MTQTNPILPEVRAGTVSREALVQAALKEITQNYREASLSNVAREYGVSLAYVSECVRAQTGRTYKELLQKHRMETAARLLRRRDMNIQQIISLVWSQPAGIPAGAHRPWPRQRIRYLL